VPVTNLPSWCDISGRGFTIPAVSLQNARSDIGSTLNPAVRFFVFDAQPNMERLLPPAGGTPLPQGPQLGTAGEVVDRVFWCALGRAPSPAERRDAEDAVRGSARPGGVSPGGIADLLWAVLMKPTQLI
jgi:hypothetical protein